ncbi:MAG: hypothetical protein Q7S32_01890 [bacterium]|nr:hypothetical protein [bacterium]
MTSRKLLRLLRSFSIAISIILIWRGTWYLLDLVDQHFFGGNHIFTAIGGIIVGILILYFPDHDLKELSKL